MGPHPDDESFGPAGTLAMLSSQKHRTGLVTLTRGEAGSLGISKEEVKEIIARKELLHNRRYFFDDGGSGTVH